MSSNAPAMQPATLPKSESFLRAGWRAAKKFPPVGSAWGLLRGSYFGVRKFREQISYAPGHREIRRQHWTKLQLGAGDNVLQGWLNTDLRPRRRVLAIDVTRTFPLPSGQFHYVLSEHMIEHLTFAEGRGMLSEIHRVLADGGKVRLSTPDFDFLMGLFRPQLRDEEQAFINWHVNTYSPGLPVHPLTVTNTMFRSWGHKHLYNEQTLSQLLRECGFGQITRFQTGESNDPELRDLEFHGRLVGQEVFNRIHTLVLEATKVPAPRR